MHLMQAISGRRARDAHIISDAHHYRWAHYSVLSKEDIIGIAYFDHTLYFDVLETFPEDTIIVNNTDLEVDFKKPLDFKDPPSPEKILQPIIEKKVQQLTQNNNTNIKHEDFIAFSGTGNRLGNK